MIGYDLIECKLYDIIWFHGNLLIGVKFLICAAVIFFLIYLLSHNINKRIRKALILLCEAHFAILYILQLNFISTFLEQKGSLSMEILSQLGAFKCHCFQEDTVMLFIVLHENFDFMQLYFLLLFWFFPLPVKVCSKISH